MSFADVELRHLQAMRAVATHRSFSKAAAALGFTQSAVSQQIAALERVVGEQLFHRPKGPRPVELTPAGRLLLGHATTVLDQLRAAGDELEAFRAGVGGRLDVGSFQSVSTKVLPRLVARVRKEHADLDIRLSESDSMQVLVQRLVDGELDLSFVVAPVEHERVVLTELCLDEFVALSPAGAAEPGTPMTVAELGRVPLIGQHAHDACQARIDTSLRAAGVEPRYVFRSGDNGAVQAMVRAGEGHAVMARLAVDAGDPGVLVRPIEPALPPRAIAIARVADRPLAPAAERFVAEAAAVCAEVVGGA